MRALAIVITSLLLLECFYYVDGELRPVVRYAPNGSCRRPCNNPQDCTKKCRKCPPGDPWTPPKCCEISKTVYKDVVRQK
uniref:Putative secreted peptide of 6.3 kDa n=1 Tax=Ixodes pacificus TaxID=29930 RepID=Q6B890_IXOPA|nr:putative secreted peptide of 6.3 kDa [Ixodes pacificus]